MSKLLLGLALAMLLVPQANLGQARSFDATEQVEVVRAVAGDMIAAAMTVVAQGDALIVDLRRNGGGAHPFEYRRVHPHFAVDLPEGRSINPITDSNWQDVGVQPDVAVPAEEALDKALELARAALAGDE